MAGSIEIGYRPQEERLEFQMMGITRLIEEVEAGLGTPLGHIPKVRRVSHNILPELPQDLSQREVLVESMAGFFEGSALYMKQTRHNRLDWQRDLYVIGLHTGLFGEDPITMEEIAETAEVTVERIKQIETRAYAYLRKYVRTPHGSARWQDVREKAGITKRTT